MATNVTGNQPILLFNLKTTTTTSNKKNGVYNVFKHEEYNVVSLARPFPTSEAKRWVRVWLASRTQALLRGGRAEKGLV